MLTNAISRRYRTFLISGFILILIWGLIVSVSIEMIVVVRNRLSNLFYILIIQGFPMIGSILNSPLFWQL